MSIVIDYWVRKNDPLLGLEPQKYLPRLDRSNCFEGGLLLAENLYVYIAEGVAQGRRGRVFTVCAYRPSDKSVLWRQPCQDLAAALDYCQQLGAKSVHGESLEAVV